NTQNPRYCPWQYTANAVSIGFQRFLRHPFDSLLNHLLDGFARHSILMMSLHVDQTSVGVDHRWYDRQLSRCARPRDDMHLTLANKDTVLAVFGFHPTWNHFSGFDQ